MKISRNTVLASFLCAFVVPQVHAASEVATFRAGVGKSQITSAMDGCGSQKTKPWSHRIVFYDDHTFMEGMDLNDDGGYDVQARGVWEEPREGYIAMIFDGDITQGSGGATGWAAVLQSMETTLREQCSDNSVKVLYATVSMKEQWLKLNKARNQAEMLEETRAYALGSQAGTGKVRRTVRASGDYLVP